jgi:hypothetical protein
MRRIGIRNSRVGTHDPRILEFRVPSPVSRLILLGAAALLFAVACGEHGRPDPQVEMAPSHERTLPRETEDQPGRQQVPSRLEVPPDVVKTYQGVQIHWKEAAGREGNLDVPLGGTARIPGSDLDVGSDVYLPSFTMAGDAITSTGTGEENPAARVTVSEKGKELFAGWIFKRFPDVHPFQHPKYSIRLEGGVRRPS